MVKVLTGGKGGKKRPAAKPKGKPKSKGKTGPASSTPEAPAQNFHNQDDRAALLRLTRKTEAELKAEIKELNEQITELLATNIKGRLGMTLKAYKTSTMLLDMDPGKRADFLTDVREASAALKVGDQLDFMAVIEKNDRDALHEFETKAIQLGNPYEAGRALGLKGGSRADNPYPLKSKEFKKFDEGHHDGLIEKLTSGQGGADETGEGEPDREAAE